MTTLIEIFEEHTKGRTPEDIAEDIALGLSLTGILFVLLQSVSLML
jgi:hypothetical protein